MKSLKKRFASFAPFLLLAFMGIGIISSVYITRHQQNTSSNASAEMTCAPVTQSSVQAFQPAEDIAVQTKTLVGKTHALTGISFSDRAETAADVKQVAQNRKKELVRLMQRSPKKALSSVLSQADQLQVASVTTDCVETPISTEGTLSFAHYDYTDGRASDVYTLTTPDNKKITLFPAGDKQPLQDGMHIKATGYKVDNNLLVDTSTTSNVTVLGNGVVPDIATSQGVQNTYLVLGYFLNTPKPTMSTTTAHDSFFTTVNNYFKEVSYNKTSLTGDMTNGWIQFNANQSCDFAEVSNAALNAIGSAAITQYDRFVIYAPVGEGCGYNGVSNIGKTLQLSGNGIVKDISISIINTSVYNGTADWLTRVASHEYGHNLGIHHACITTCDAGTPQIEYGDPFTVMGKNFYGGGDQVVEWNAVHRDYVGWFSATNIKTVTTAGNFTLEPIENITSGLQAIKIPRGGGDFLYVEYRQPLKVDQNITQISGQNILSGALLHTIVPFTQPTTEKSLLVDTSPSSPIPASAIPLGGSYTDPASHATISVTGQTAAGLTLAVSFDGSTPPSPTATAPTATPTISQNPTIPPTETPTGPTATPIPGTSLTPTPTNEQLSPPPTPTPGVGPCSGSQCPQIAVTVFLHGIGKGGDNQNPNATGNQNPKHQTRNALIGVFTKYNILADVEQLSIQYNQNLGGFTGTVSLPNLESNTPYTVRIWVDNYLTSPFPGIYANTATGISNLPAVKLVTGDMNFDNVLNILDYNQLISCYSGIVKSKSCASQSEYDEADITDDGLVNQDDYNLFLRELLTQHGA